MRIRAFTHLNGWRHGAVYYNNCLCNYINNNKHGNEIQYNGFDIEYINIYSNNQIKYKYNYIVIRCFTGNYDFYEPGQLCKKSIYLNKSHYLFRYHPHGYISYKQIYLTDQLTKWIEYHKNGSVKSISNWINNRKHGDEIEYDENGSIKNKCIWNYGFKKSRY